jgi:hypothetical protein
MGRACKLTAGEASGWDLGAQIVFNIESANKHQPIHWIAILNAPDLQKIRKVDVFPHHDWHQ